MNEHFLVPTSFWVWLTSFRHNCCSSFRACGTQTGSVPFLLYVHQSFWWGATDGVDGAEASMFLLSSILPLFLAILFYPQYSAQGHTSIITLSAMHPSVPPPPFFSLYQLFIFTMMVNHKTCIFQWVQLSISVTSVYVTRVLLYLWNIIY